MPSRKNEASWSDAKARWRIDVQADGKRRSFYSAQKGRKGKIACEAKADTWLGDKQDAGDNPRLGALWARYLEDVKATTGSGNTVKTEQIGRLYILPSLQHKPIASITMQDWQDCINAAGKRGLSRKTCSNIRGAVTTLYRYCRRNRIIMERPELLTVPRDAPVGVRAIIQPEQIRLVFAVDWIPVNGTKRPLWCVQIWRLCLLTGLRRGELAGLKWADIEGNILHVSRSINNEQEETRGKNDNARRFIALSPRMVLVLDDQRAMLKRASIVSPWVFPGPDGERIHPDRIDREWMLYRKAHGITCSIHEMRHTMISIVSPDVPDALLKPIVGHSKAMDTDKYRHVVDGQAVRAAAMIDDVFSRILD